MRSEQWAIRFASVLLYAASAAVCGISRTAADEGSSSLSSIGLRRLEQASASGCTTCTYSYERALEWYEIFGDGQGLPEANVVSCLKELNQGIADITAASRGKLAVVISHPVGKTPDIATLGLINGWESYCRHHGCTLLQNPVQAVGADLFSVRWLSILEASIWQQFEWILHIEEDVMPVNMTLSFKPFIPDDGAHLVLSMRGQYNEVASAAVFIRTTPFSTCFIKYLARLRATNQAVQADQDLAQAVLDFVDPDLARYCLAERLKKPSPAAGDAAGIKQVMLDFMPCFTRVHASLPYVHLALPFRFFFSMMGFLHRMAGHAPSDVITDVEQAIWEGLYRHCWSSDFLRHGYKELGQLWAGRNATAGEWPPCARLSDAAELRIAKKCCLWHYPGCINSTGHNRCRHLPHCHGSVSGMPNKECLESAAPWLEIQPQLAPYLEKLPDEHRIAI